VPTHREQTRILIWATTFGADLWSLARWLDSRDDVAMRVVLDDPELFARQPIARLFPLRSPLVRRRRWHRWIGLPGFRPDITILDNWVPRRAPSPAGFVLWHGFGWKGPNDRVEFSTLHRQLARCWGDPLQPNPRFRWHCFGPSDFTHRTEVSGFAPQNCRIVGAASHDLLVKPFDRELVARDYPFDVVRAKTVLFAPTWHYGEVFAHWGSDADLLDRFVARVRSRGANLIFRLHDRFRFPPEYVALVERIARKHGHVKLEFKNESPDNFVAMQIADVLVTNFSSIANLFYATGRPTIHVYPVKSEDEAFTWRTFHSKGATTRTVPSAKYVWKFPPERNGGLLARSFDEMLEALDRALEEPSCCSERATDFLRDHMMGADGLVRERIWDALRELR
jgi:hypothetical protein